jgi:hypothetical protein
MWLTVFTSDEIANTVTSTGFGEVFNGGGKGESLSIQWMNFISTAIQHKSQLAHAAVGLSRS